MEFEDAIICLVVIAVYPGLHIYSMARARRAQPLWHPMGRASELLADALSAPIEPLPRRPVYGPFSSEASNKAIALLKRWLSPEQRRELEKRGSFDVVGSHTGRRYRIYPGKLNNVRILQDNFEVAASPAVLETGDSRASQVKTGSLSFENMEHGRHAR